MRDELAFVLLASKPLMYGWFFALPRLWIPEERRPSRWKPIWAGLLRFALGWLVGLPAALLSLKLGPENATLVLCTVRYALWAGLTRIFFPELTWTRTHLFAFGATAFNVILDFTLFPDHWTSIRFC